MSADEQQNAYALMGDWIVHGELIEGHLTKGDVFKPDYLMTQSYVWDAFRVLTKAGVFDCYPENGRAPFFKSNLSSQDLMEFLRSIEIDQKAFEELFSAFVGCGDLNGLMTKSPKEVFLVDRKAQPIFETLEKLGLIGRKEGFYFWRECARAMISMNSVWPSEDPEPEYKKFKNKISNEALQILDLFANKYKSETPGIATRTIAEKIFPMIKGLRLLPKSDHGILDRLERDDLIPESCIPDIRELAKRFGAMGVSRDDFIYFGQDTSMSLLKAQAMFVLKADTGDGYDDRYAKRYLEEKYPNPWGVVIETLTWVY